MMYSCDNDTVFLHRYIKGVPFFHKRYMKGVPFLERKGLHLVAESPHT